MRTGNLQPIIELESENQVSRLGLSPVVKDTPGFQKYNRSQPQEEDYERIFSDTDESSSRLNDSILDSYGQMDKQPMKFKESIGEFNLKGYAQQNDRGLQLIGRGLPDNSVDLTLTQSKINNPYFASGFNQDKTMNDSILNIVRELDGANGAITRQRINQQSLNDSQIINKKYRETLEMMTQLQNQLSLQDSLSNSKKQQANSAASQAIPVATISLKSPSVQQYQYPSIPQQQTNQERSFLRQQMLSPPPSSMSSSSQNVNQQTRNLSSGQEYRNSSFRNLENSRSSQKNPFTPMAAQISPQSKTFLPNGFTSPVKVPSSYYQPLSNYKNPLQKENSQSNLSIQLSPDQSYSRIQSQSTRWVSPKSDRSSFNQFGNREKRDFFQNQQEILKKTEMNLRQNSTQYDPFAKQKRMENEVISQINYNRMVEEQLPVFCINCEEYVQLADIDKHADTECQINQQKKIKRKLPQTSSSSSFFKQQNTQQETLEIINDKISSIESQLNQRMALKKRANNESPQVLTIMESSISAAKQLKMNGLTLDDINVILKQISSARTQLIATPTKSQLGNIGMIILWDRLLILGQEKAANTPYQKNNIPVLNLDARLNATGTSFSSQNSRRDSSKLLEQQFNQTQNQMKNYPQNQMSGQKMLDLSNQGINYSSDVKSKQAPFQFASNFQSERDAESLYSVTVSNAPSNVIPSNHLLALNQNAEDRKKFFFSTALNLKFKLPQNHPGKSASIQDLYEQALKLNIPQEKWADYLRDKIK